MFLLAVSNRIKFSAFVLIIGLILSRAGLASTLEEIPIIAIDYPPFTIQGPDNDIVQDVEKFGLSFQHLEPILNQHGYTAKPIFYPSARANRVLRNRENWCFSFIPPSILQPEFKQVILNRKPISFYFYRKKSPNLAPFKWQDLTELRGKTLAVLRVVYFSPLYQKIKDSNIILYSTENIASAFKMLVKGRVSMVLADEVSAQYFNEMGIINLEELEHSENTVYTVKSRFWLNTLCPKAEKLHELIK